MPLSLITEEADFMKQGPEYPNHLKGRPALKRGGWKLYKLTNVLEALMPLL